MGVHHVRCRRDSDHGIDSENPKDQHKKLLKMTLFQASLVIFIIAFLPRRSQHVSSADLLLVINNRCSEFISLTQTIGLDSQVRVFPFHTFPAGDGRYRSKEGLNRVDMVNVCMVLMMIVLFTQFSRMFAKQRPEP